MASGRPGAGPGEYQALAGLWSGRGDSLLASDLRAQRLTVLGAGGQVGRTFALGGRSGLAIGEGGAVSLALPQAWLPDGSILGLDMPIRAGAAGEGVWRDTVTLIRFGPDGAPVDTVGRFPGMEMTRMTLTFGGQTIPTPAPVPLGRNTFVAAVGERVAVATNEGWEVRQYAPGEGLRRVVRRALVPGRLTSDEVRAHRAEQLELMEGLPELRAVPPPLREQMMERVRTVSYPETLPPIAGLLAGRDGRLWVQETSRPGDERARFVVLGPDGLVEATVRMPARFQPFAVGRDEVLGVWRDPEDVEYVRAYPLRR
jgi:hypothetical protein